MIWFYLTCLVIYNLCCVEIFKSPLHNHQPPTPIPKPFLVFSKQPLYKYESSGVDIWEPATPLSLRGTQMQLPSSFQFVYWHELQSPFKLQHFVSLINLLMYYHRKRDKTCIKFQNIVHNLVFVFQPCHWHCRIPDLVCHFVS